MCCTHLRDIAYPPTADVRPRGGPVLKARRSIGSREARRPALITAMAHLVLWLLAAAVGFVHAQPSPEVQKRISAAIKGAARNTTDIDYTQFVNVFIGTDNFGDVWWAF